MGISGGHQIFHHANVGGFSNLLVTLKHRAASNDRIGHPIVYFDASWLGRKFAGRDVYSRIGDLVYIFAKNGVSVVVVLDVVIIPRRQGLLVSPKLNKLDSMH